MSETLDHSPAHVVRQMLMDLGHCSASSFPAYVNYEPPTPDDCVTVFDTQGTDHGRTAPDSERQVHHGIQVRVRSQYPEAGYRKARQIALALDGVYDLGVTVVGDVTRSYVVLSVNRTSEVLSLGREVAESKRPLFVVNALVPLRQVP